MTRVLIETLLEVMGADWPNPTQIALLPLATMAVNQMCSLSELSVALQLVLWKGFLYQKGPHIGFEELVHNQVSLLTRGPQHHSRVLSAIVQTHCV